MKDGYKNFYCGLCKQSKTKAERQKIILYNVEDNELLSSDLCKNDFQKLRYLLSTRQNTTKGQESLDSWKLEIE
jgi:hypothetical protein